MIKYLKLILFLLISSNLFAQTFGGGVLAGLSASQLDGDLSGGYHKAGFCAGVYTNAKLNNYIDAQLELRYVQKGSNSNSKETEIPYKSKLNYIELPVYLKYNFWDKFSANIGLAAAYLQKATEDKDGVGDEPADPEFNPFEFSGLAGVEYQIIDRLFFNVRFNYSILAVRDHPGDQTFFLNKGQYNNVLTFTLHYQISKSDEKKRKKGCDCPKWGKRFSLR
jgi:opacity protein-like surface antigen